MVAPIVLVPIALGSVVCGAKKATTGIKSRKLLTKSLKKFRKNLTSKKALSSSKSKKRVLHWRGLVETN
ncbi:MAG: hypothetical protein Q4A11_03570 [Brachymonas sp.]|nr:hypothetical protein [Brachymonas sp.]